jgi:DNA mismatch repair protein MutS2
MKFFPESALVQLEYDKIKGLLKEQCDSEFGKSRAEDLRIHTKKEFIDHELKQSDEFKQLLEASQYFPNDYILNLTKELKLLGIPGALLTGEQFLQIRKLPESIQKIFRWFDKDRKDIYQALYSVIANTYFEKVILELIDDVIDETGNVKDNCFR